MPNIPTTDLCGNPLPIPPLPSAPSLPSLEELLALLLGGFKIPEAEFPTPCPLAIEAAEEAAKSAI